MLLVGLRIKADAKRGWGNERRSIPVSRPNKDSTWIGKQAGIKGFAYGKRVISGIRRNKI